MSVKLELYCEKILESIKERPNEWSHTGPFDFVRHKKTKVSISKGSLTDHMFLSKTPFGNGHPIEAPERFQTSFFEFWIETIEGTVLPPEEQKYIEHLNAFKGEV